MVMEFNATFNNISAISQRSVLLVEETGVPGENHCRKYGNNNDNNFQSKTDKNGCLCVWHSKTATLKHNPDISVIDNKEEISNFM